MQLNREQVISISTKGKMRRILQTVQLVFHTGPHTSVIRHSPVHDVAPVLQDGDCDCHVYRQTE